MRAADLDRLLADAERVLDDEGVESFMDEGPDIITSLVEAVRDLRRELVAERAALTNAYERERGDADHGR